ncbi:uncharacterized protein JCM15063_000994 [Sporobolomyces koalae]|uniref:uncharacterized protein n=1 Tax=Sporobolomyces koalae TaxID=500713 RepID=UPI00317A9E7E
MSYQYSSTTTNRGPTPITCRTAPPSVTGRPMRVDLLTAPRRHLVAVTHRSRSIRERSPDALRHPHRAPLSRHVPRQVFKKPVEYNSNKLFWSCQDLNAKGLYDPSADEAIYAVDAQRERFEHAHRATGHGRSGDPTCNGDEATVLKSSSLRINRIDRLVRA